MFLNQVNVSGRLGKDAEVKQFDGGQVTGFSLAINSSYKNAKGETIEQTTWANVEFFGTWFKEPLNKGDEVVISGSLVSQQWEKDGVKNSMLKIKAQQIAKVVQSSK